ncbi:hypothetical protein [Amycolatopsis sp. NPDC051102]|uniref:hypothetical protein n=1 Tax=Amycolatopsis sp. NPDC051102 TaxID=3155163 RepID=UPI003424BF65
MVAVEGELAPDVDASAGEVAAGLGRSLFERPGEHALVLSLDGFVSPPAVVRVRR